MISVVLPAYNEEKNIKNAVDGIYNFFVKKMLPFEIIVVNDGSTDNTGEILNGCEGIKNITIISHEKNMGYGAALRSGFIKSIGDLIFFTDSDCQFDIKDIDKFLTEINEYDFVIGYRNGRMDSKIRIFYGFMLRYAAKILFGINVKDVDCAFKLFNKNTIKSLNLSENGALINLEILSLARLAGYKFLELPVNHFPRIAGNQTGGNFKVVFAALYMLPMLWLRINKI